MTVPRDGFQITRSRSGGTVCASVAGELDLATAPRWRERLKREKHEDIDALLLVDSRRLDFFYSSGLHLPVWAHEEHGRRLHIVLGSAAGRFVDLKCLRHQLPILDDSP